MSGGITNQMPAKIEMPPASVPLGCAAFVGSSEATVVLASRAATYSGRPKLANG